jgi:hypothetical protein
MHQLRRKVMIQKTIRAGFQSFSKYHMKIALEFNAILSTEDILKLIIGNKSLHQETNDSGVRTVNFATPKKSAVKSMMFLH